MLDKRNAATRRTLGLWVLVTVACLGLASASWASIEYLGTQPQFGWTQPEGFPVAEWRVYVSRNGADPTVEQTVTEQLVTISGEVGETLVIQVQAVSGEHESELSEMSEEVTLRVLPQPGGVALYCEAGLTEVAPGWWSCQ